ncbi:MAG TPA: tetratricopeptide repeat protein [Syntrophorhabdaceae bacterium]|nr:tetratricopeptide repeat protein [Syntrophorhabdaceae bacterium]
MGFLKNIFTLGRDKAYEEAMRLFNLHDYRGAIQKFEEILKRKTASTSIHYNLSKVYISQSHRNIGIILFAMGKYAEALLEFKMALQYNPGYNELNYFIGVCLNNLGDFKNAIESFNNVIEVDPSNLPAKLKLGIALSNYKMWDTAENLYKNILKTNPNYADIHYNLGLAYMGKGKVDDAVNSFKEALKINQNYLQARIKIIVAQIYKGELEPAKESLNMLAEKYPNYADIFYYLGIVHASQNNLNDAVDSLRRAIDINPSYKDARIKLGSLYCHLQRFQEGIRELEEACKIDPKDEDILMFTNTIKNAITSKDYSGEKFSEILNRLFASDRGIIDFVPEFNRGVEIIPDISEMISIVMSVSEEDRTLCEMLIPFVKEHITEKNNYPDLHNSLGSLYLKLNRYKEAEGCFRRAVELNPKYLKARFNLFFTLKMLERFEDALEQGQYILDSNASYPDFYCQFADVCLSMSMYDRALENINRALEINSKYSVAHFIAAQVYEKTGDFKKAIYHLKECIDSNPSGLIYSKAKEMLERLENQD